MKLLVKIRRLDKESVIKEFINDCYLKINLIFIVD